MELSFAAAIADRHISCSLCRYVVEPGEIFWRARSSCDSKCDGLWLCTAHIPLNAKGMIIEPSEVREGITRVRADAMDVRSGIIPTLLGNWDANYELTPEEFEELVFDRILAMNLQGFRMGAANRKDGGIDIVFWSCGVLPILGAVQVKHHRSPSAKVGASHVSEFAGAMGAHRFNVGLMVTNTSFTDEARHRARMGLAPVQLRDGFALRKWMADDFSIEKLDFVIRNAEFCKGIVTGIPQFA
jgi:hypothetical protein